MGYLDQIKAISKAGAMKNPEYAVKVAPPQPNINQLQSMYQATSNTPATSTQQATTQPVKKTASGSLDRPTNTQINPYFFSANGSPTQQSTVKNVSNVYGYTTAYNPTSNTITVSNPADYYKREFKSGEVANGLGGLDGSGNNMVSDINAFNNAVTNPLTFKEREEKAAAEKAAKTKFAEEEARRKAILDQGMLDLDSEAALIERKTQQASNNLARLLEQRKGEYFNKRNEADTQKFMMLKRLQEEAAAKGLYFDSQTGTNALQAQLVSENTKNALDQDEQNYISDVTNQLADLDQNSAADLQALYEKKRLANESYGREGLAAKDSADAALESKLAELSRLYQDRKRSDFESDRTFNYNAEQDTLQNERQSKLDKIAAEEADLQKQATQLEIDERQIKLDYLKDPNSPENQARLLELEEKKQAIEYRKAQIASEKAQAASSYALAAKRSSGGGGSKSLSDNSNAKTIDSQVGALVKSFESDANIVVPNGHYDEEKNVWVKDDGVKQDWIRAKGSEQYNIIYNKIMGANISDDDKEFLLQKYRLPY